MYSHAQLAQNASLLGDSAEAYGSAPWSTARFHGKANGGFIRGKRFSLNMLPVGLNLLLPWGLFTVVFAAMSFSVHYEHASITYGIIGVALLGILLSGFYVFELRVRKHYYSEADRAPSWIVFLFVTLAVSLVTALILGDWNYKVNTKPYYDMNNLGKYTDIDATRMRGQQLMDAGIVDFANGSRIDVSKSMGFKNSKMYCVAPISLGNETLSTYDFWAVGTDCCSGYQADFHCTGFNDPRTNGGLRLVRESDRPFFRLAVQQAEATHQIRAVHPLFFHWVQDPRSVVEGWRSDGRRYFLAGTMVFFVVQAFLVAVALISFSKLGKW